jgi:RNA polymerase sigma-70 factor (ECF subfamily)
MEDGQTDVVHGRNEPGAQGGETTNREACMQTGITAGQALLRAGQAEEAKAQFEAVIDLMYRYYQDDVYRLCLSRLHHAVWAEEVSQDVLSAAYFALPGFRHDASVRTWLSGICHRQIQQALRNVGRRHTLLQANQDAVQASVHPAEHTYAVHALLALLREYGVHTLRKREQILFVKRFIEGYTIAELTTPWLSEAAVRRRLSQIVQRLQRQQRHD